jgi:hypothetical protein
LTAAAMTHSARAAEQHWSNPYATAVLEFLKQFGALVLSSAGTANQVLRQRQNSICADEPRGRKAARKGSQTQ